jgi:phosphoribosyl 1,2-cyclic phosphodiesterase
MSSQELRDRLRLALERSKGVDLEDPIAIERYLDRLPPNINQVVSGNTSCYELRIEDQVFILDMGSGIRLLGKQLMGEAFGRGAGEAHIFITHTHYDHVEGFPFFVPAFIPGNHLIFYSPFPDLEERLRQLMRHPFFPIDLDYPQAKRTFVTLNPGQVYGIQGVQVRWCELHHPGGAVAYRFESANKALVYATDGEYLDMSLEKTDKYIEFFRQANALIFDAMYTYEEAVTNKADWGHSTAKAGAELAWRAEVKRLILHHHDPISSDKELWDKLDDADHHLRFRAAKAGNETHQPVEVILAYEGLNLNL